ncbi:MAG: hypothetical protein M4579_006038 [Chaenotheca gracillima]|nr:MAG: hypothetical protein M4579_006038 [Chaenotheca gracillima]
MEQSAEHLTIQTERLILRPLRSSDLEDVWAIRTRPDCMQWTSSRPETNIAQSQEYLSAKIKSKPTEAFNLAVDLREPQTIPGTNVKRTQMIGMMGAHHVPEIGWVINPDFWGKGYGSEALSALLCLFWKRVPSPAETHTDGASAGEDEDGEKMKAYDYAEAKTDSANIASRRLAEKVGFVLWEEREKFYDSPNLGLRDTAFYRIPRPGTTLAPRPERKDPVGDPSR